MFGILVVENDTVYQPISEVSSMKEAIEMANDYIVHANPDADDLAPESFIVWRRGTSGRYSERTELAMPVQSNY